MFLPVLSIILIVAVEADIIGHGSWEYELRLVQAVIRHGDRAATDRFATDESAKILFRGLGELSDDGIDHAYLQGVAFKKKYVTSAVIDKRFLPTEVRVRASNVPRVLMSAGSFANGLFQKTPDGNASIIPPIYTSDDDPMLHTPFDCSNGWEDVMKDLGLSSTVNISSTSLEKMEETKWPSSCKDVPANMADAIISELPNKKIHMSEAYNNCAKKPAKEFMYDYISMLGGSGKHFNELRLKRTVGLLTNELLRNMNEMSGCGTADCISGKEKLHVYYSHDVNVLALAHVFQSIGFYQGITPAFSSALVIELWSHRSKGDFVKIMIKNGHDQPFALTNLNTLDQINKDTKKFAIQEPALCEPNMK